MPSLLKQLLLQVMFAAGICFSVAAHGAQYFYSINSLDSTLSSYVSDAGVLRHAGFISVPKNPKALLVHPDKKTVYVLSKTTAQISVFRQEVHGLHELDFSPYSLSLPSPFAMQFHNSGQFLYVASRAGAILAYRIEADRSLNPVKGSPYKSGQRTRSLVLHPSGNYLYAVNAHSNTISAYSVDVDSGALIPLPESPYVLEAKDMELKTAVPLVDFPSQAGGVPYFVNIHPSGGYLYVTHWATASVSVYKINPDGRLSRLAGNPFPTGLNPFSVTPHPNGKFVYISSWGEHRIYAYRVDANGALSLMKRRVSTAGKTPATLVFNESGAIAYVVNTQTDSITAFGVNTKTGAMHIKQHLQTRPGPWELHPGGLADANKVLKESTLIDSNKKIQKSAKNSRQVKKDQGKGEFLFALDKFRRYLTAYEVQNDGKLREIANTTLAGRPVDLVSTKQYGVVVAYEDTGSLDAYTLSLQRKQWTRLARQTLQLGKGKKQLLLDNNEKYLYVLNRDRKTLHSIQVEASTQMVLLEALSDRRSEAVKLTLDPAGRYLFEVNGQPRDVAVKGFRDPAEVLSYERRKWGSPYTLVGTAQDAVVSRGGNFLLISHSQPQQLAVYSVQHRTGALELLPDSVIPMPLPVNVIASHPTESLLYVVAGKTITVYKWFDVTGTLKEISQFKTNLPPVSMVIEPGGEFAYVSYSKRGAVDVLEIDKAGGLKFKASTKTRGRHLLLFSTI
ncbi:MAG: lactonase family protein [Gammaproteobacteria bacterium]|nr:lactonase family protein [Gammaproteobacteria bacterium]MDH5800825.1 lactonase family protein [Gammaproteobacteria bacterium]